MDAGTGKGGQDPLIFRAEEVAAARVITVCIPGALARVEMFAPVQGWAAPGHALVYFRFPGLDGRALSPKLEIERAAARIAAFAAGHPDKAFRLLGYSTGGPIAIRAAERMGGDVRVAAMSGAVEKAGGIRSFQRITRDVLAASARARSLRRRAVWAEYFRVLLYGAPVLRDAKLAARAETLWQAQLPRMVWPDPALLAAHSDDLRRWTLPDGPRLAEDRLAFFIGGDDPVFSRPQTEALAAHFGAPAITAYPGHGHLLFLTHPPAFDDIRAFFEA